MTLHCGRISEEEASSTSCPKNKGGHGIWARLVPSRVHTDCFAECRYCTFLPEREGRGERGWNLKATRGYREVAVHRCHRRCYKPARALDCNVGRDIFPFPKLQLVRVPEVRALTVDQQGRFRPLEAGTGLCFGILGNNL